MVFARSRRNTGSGDLRPHAQPRRRGGQPPSPAAPRVETSSSWRDSCSKDSFPTTTTTTSQLDGAKEDKIRLNPENFWQKKCLKVKKIDNCGGRIEFDGNEERERISLVWNLQKGRWTGSGGHRSDRVLSILARWESSEWERREFTHQLYGLCNKDNLREEYVDFFCQSMLTLNPLNCVKFWTIKDSHKHDEGGPGPHKVYIHSESLDRP